MPGKKANVKNEKQYEALKDKGMSKERAAKIANSPGASKKGGEHSHSGSSSSSQGGSTAQKRPPAQRADAQLLASRRGDRLRARTRRPKKAGPNDREKEQ